MANTYENTAHAIAAALTGSWAVETIDNGRDGERFNLAHGGETVLHLRFGSCCKDKDRIEASISWPRDPETRTVFSPSSYTDVAGPTSITVSVHKTPEAVAKAITSRLLPSGLAEWNKQRERMNGERAYRNKREATMQRIAAACGLTYTAPRFASESGTIRTPAKVYRLQVDSDVTLHLHGIPADVAIQILNLVK